MPVSTPDYPSSEGNDPYGIPRIGNLAKKKVYQDDPKTSRPLSGIHARNKPSRPAVSEGNNPMGMERPDYY